MKVGRNTPCPCGSSKKYKKCCMAKSKKDPSELLWRRIGKVNEELTNKQPPKQWQVHLNLALRSA